MFSQCDFSWFIQSFLCWELIAEPTPLLVCRYLDLSGLPKYENIFNTRASGNAERFVDSVGDEGTDDGGKGKGIDDGGDNDDGRDANDNVGSGIGGGDGDASFVGDDDNNGGGNDTDGSRNTFALILLINSNITNR